MQRIHTTGRAAARDGVEHGLRARDGEGALVRKRDMLELEGERWKGAGGGREGLSGDHSLDKRND